MIRHSSPSTLASCVSSLPDTFVVVHRCWLSAGRTLPLPWIDVAQAARPRPYAVSSGWDEDRGSTGDRRSGLLEVRLKPRRQLLGHHLATPWRGDEQGLPGLGRLQRQYPHDRSRRSPPGAGHLWLGQDSLGDHPQRASGSRSDVLGNKPIRCLHGHVARPGAHRASLASHSSWKPHARRLPASMVSPAGMRGLRVRAGDGQAVRRLPRHGDLGETGPRGASVLPGKKRSAHSHLVPLRRNPWSRY